MVAHRWWSSVIFSPSIMYFDKRVEGLKVEEKMTFPLILLLRVWTWTAFGLRLYKAGAFSRVVNCI